MLKMFKMAFIAQFVLLAIYVVLRMAGVVSSPDVVESSWSKLAPAGAGYTVRVPGTMSETNETIPTLWGDIHFKEHELFWSNVNYRVGYALLQGDVVREFDDDDLTGMMALFLAQDGNTIVSQDFEDWNGHPAFRGTFDAPDGSRRIINWNILAGGRLYRILLTVDGLAIETERSYYEQFLDSFELTLGFTPSQ